MATDSLPKMTLWYDACLGMAGQVAGVSLHEERLHSVEDAAVHV